MNTAQMFEVTSSNLAAVGHDGSDLIVRFHNKSLYRYHDVPAAEVEKIRSAESAGRYFAANIKPNFRYSQVQ